jgi:hypothetical protein
MKGFSDKITVIILEICWWFRLSKRFSWWFSNGRRVEGGNIGDMSMK